MDDTMKGMMDDIMKIMPSLIAEEAQDAMKYANLALKYRVEDQALADLFMQLSGQELHHMQMISDKLSGMVEMLHSQYTGE